MDRSGVELGALRAFKAVAEHGSVSGAARALSYVQSNVTARIRRLEAILGVPLFHRQSRGMALTQSGEVLLTYATRVLGLVDEACGAIGKSAGEDAPLRIGALESTAAVRLPPILAALHAARPQLQILVTTGPTDPLLQGVLAFRLDGAFVAAKVDHPDIHCTPAFDEELVVARARDAAAGRPNDPRPLVVFRQGCPYRAQAERWLRAKGAIPYRLMEFGTLDGILGCVSAGMGITMLPRSVIDRPHYREILSFEPLPRNIGRVRTMFVCRRGGERLPGIRRLLAAIAEKKSRRRD